MFVFSIMSTSYASILKKIQSQLLTLSTRYGEIQLLIYSCRRFGPLLVLGIAPINASHADLLAYLVFLTRQDSLKSTGAFNSGSRNLSGSTSCEGAFLRNNINPKALNIFADIKVDAVSVVQFFSREYISVIQDRNLIVIVRSRIEN